VSPDLNLVLTKYATEQGITKAEAADRIFNILYPKGVGAEAQTSLAPPSEGTEEGAEAPSSGLELEEEGEDISDQLGKTVKDLRAVHTIRALTSGLNQKEGDDKITMRDALELKRIEAMFGGSKAAQGSDALDATFRKYIEPLQNQIKELESKFHEQRVADAERERDEYKKRLEERDSREERQQEMMSLLSPMQEQFKEISDRVTSLAESLKSGTKEKPTREEASEETKAIIQLATEMRTAIQKMGSGGATSTPQTLTDTIDTLTTLIDKLNEIGTKFRGGGEGDFDWRAATVSTLGEVATEAFKTYRDVHGGVEEGEEESSSSGEKKEKLSEQVILRRVYNYAVKKISEGQLQLNPYEAATELNLSPNRVWWAIEECRKKGMLKSGTSAGATKEKGEAATGTTKTPEQLQAEGLLDI
jgi:DNA repair exonuclease SbcCD ATPase subunit